MPRTAYCHDCHRPVLWTVTDAGKRLAVDPEPNQDGNTVAFRDGHGVFRSRRPTEELPAAAWEKTYMPHVATCPKKPQPRATTAPAALPPGVADLSAYRRGRGRS